MGSVSSVVTRFVFLEWYRQIAFSKSTLSLLVRQMDSSGKLFAIFTSSDTARQSHIPSKLPRQLEPVIIGASKTVRQLFPLGTPRMPPSNLHRHIIVSKCHSFTLRQIASFKSPPSKCLSQIPSAKCLSKKRSIRLPLSNPLRQIELGNIPYSLKVVSEVLK